MTSIDAPLNQTLTRSSEAAAGHGAATVANDAVRRRQEQSGPQRLRTRDGW